MELKRINTLGGGLDLDPTVTRGYLDTTTSDNGARLTPATAREAAAYLLAWADEADPPIVRKGRV